MFQVTEQQYRACRIFSDASGDTIIKLISVAFPHKYSKNQTIYEQNDSSDDFHLLVSGKVRAKGVSPDGKEVTYGDITPGLLFGEFSAIDGVPRSSNIVAVEDVLALRMPASALIGAIETDGKVALNIIRHLLEKTRLQTDRIYEFSVLAVRERIQQELLRLADYNGGDTGLREISIPTHQELANRLSTHREAVTRELRLMDTKGLIDSNRNQIIIHDVARLAQFAGNLKT